MDCAVAQVAERRVDAIQLGILHVRVAVFTERGGGGGTRSNSAACFDARTHARRLEHSPTGEVTALKPVLAEQVRRPGPSESRTGLCHTVGLFCLYT